jgi:hypothetical protein
MSAKAKTETNGLENLEKLVTKSFDQDDATTQHAIAQWRADQEKARAQQAASEVVAAFTSPLVLEAVLAFHKADIEENIAIYKAKVAHSERQLKFMNMRVALGAAQGYFVDDEAGDRVVPAMLAVMRTSKEAKTRMLHQLVQTLKRGAEQGVAPEEADLPAGLGDGVKALSADLTEFEQINGDNGRQLVVQVCEDASFAEKVSADERLPKCIRFLAQVVSEISTSNKLPAPERRMGFNVAAKAANQ